MIRLFDYLRGDILPLKVGKGRMSPRICRGAADFFIPKKRIGIDKTQGQAGLGNLPVAGITPKPGDFIPVHLK
jgi:hypothetical protein